MNCRARCCMVFASLLAVAVSCPPLLAQQGKPPAAEAPAPKAPAPQAPVARAATPQALVSQGPNRQLAPGVMLSVDPARELQESFSRHNIVELLAVNPTYDWAKDVPFRHDIWALKFQFKPMRMIWVDIPQTGGHMERKLIWYLVYAVTNPGKTMHPVLDANNTFKVEYVDRPARFIPEFLLETYGRLQDKSEFQKVHHDRLIPVATAAIRMREDRSRRFYNTAEICREIAVGETVWGIVTWEEPEDVDPRLVRFSIYVRGLTNAYKWKDEPGAYKKDDAIGTGRRLAQKTLKLNFWRPGDEYYENEKEIRIGAPGAVDYEWVYR